MPVRIRSSIAANSGPRWLIIWRAPASRTDGGSPVGPGMRRLGSKRSTGKSPGALTVTDGGAVGRRSRPGGDHTYAATGSSDHARGADPGANRTGRVGL